jgi:hypothetical protein
MSRRREPVLRRRKWLVAYEPAVATRAQACVTMQVASLPLSLHLVQGPLGLDGLSQPTLRLLHQSQEVRRRERGALVTTTELVVVVLLVSAVTTVEAGAAERRRSLG